MISLFLISRITCVFFSTSAISGTSTGSAWLMEEKGVRRGRFYHILYHWWTLRQGQGQDRIGRVLVGSVKEVFAIFHVFVEFELRETKDSWVDPETLACPLLHAPHCFLLFFSPSILSFSLCFSISPCLTLPSLSFLTHPAPHPPASPHPSPVNASVIPILIYSLVRG